MRISRSDARGYRRDGRPWHYLDNGSRELVWSEHCNRLVIRWMVRERGIALAGPEPRSFVDPIPRDEMCDEIDNDCDGQTDEELNCP